MTTNSEKKDMSLAEFVVIIAIVGILMAVFINFYIKNESQFKQAGFATIAQTFNTKVNAVHAQWMMDNQPKVVYVASLYSKGKQAIPVNKAGWIDAQQTKLSCEAIWQLVMEMPISDVKLSVSALEMHIFYSELNNTNSECRYVLQDGSYFQYNPAKGKVSKVMTIN
jgi:competence protein ComGC